MVGSFSGNQILVHEFHPKKFISRAPGCGYQELPRFLEEIAILSDSGSSSSSSNLVILFSFLLCRWPAVSRDLWLATNREKKKPMTRWTHVAIAPNLWTDSGVLSYRGNWRASRFKKNRSHGR